MVNIRKIKVLSEDGSKSVKTLTWAMDTDLGDAYTHLANGDADLGGVTAVSFALSGYLTGINLISLKSNKPLFLSFELPLNTIFVRPGVKVTRPIFLLLNVSQDPVFPTFPLTDLSPA